METTSKFYKILMAVTYKLQFPRGFTEKYGHMIPENAKLKIASRATWEVRVKKQEDGYFFTTGWADFCGDMKLELFDMLHFSYDGDSTFHVTAFADTAFEKASNFQAVNTKKLNPSFQVLFKINHASRLFVNNGFVEACGLLDKQKVRFEYPGGRSREVVVNRSKKRLHVYISKGWSDFVKANGLAIGKTYLFQYMESEKVIRVEPISVHAEEDSNNPSCFQLLFKKHHVGRLYLKEGFVEACGLMEKQQVRLEYPGGQSREVGLIQWMREDPNVHLSKGWSEFVKANGLAIGKTYSFEFIRSEEVIRVQQQSDSGSGSSSSSIGLSPSCSC